MNFIFNYSFEIALGTFLIMWLIYRRNGTWQNTITAQYQDEKIIQKRYKDVFRAVIGTLNYCNFAIQKKNYREGYITAQSSWTMKSFGEDITIKMKENTQGTHVAFRSRCKLETQLFDWGKNKQNTQKFFDPSGTT